MVAVAQQGFVYEVNATKALKKFGLIPAGFKPAGAGHDQPDLLMEYNGVQAGVELKITAASAGSLVLKYDSTKKHPWGFGNIKADDKEKLFIKELADYVKLFSVIEKKWKNKPYKREPQDSRWQATAGKLTNQKRYERDLKMFKEISGEIPAQKIEEYYVKKKTYYVNVGTHGFFLMGTKNPFKLKGVPRFSEKANAKYRCRVQYKGGGNYQFTFEMSFSMKGKSPYNIAPLKSGSVNIVKKDMDLSCFELL